MVLRASSDLFAQPLPPLTGLVRGLCFALSECLPCAVFKVRANREAVGSEESGVGSEGLGARSVEVPVARSFAFLLLPLGFPPLLGVSLSRTLKTIQSSKFSVSISIGLTALLNFRFLPSRFACRIHLFEALRSQVLFTISSSWFLIPGSSPKRST